MGEKRGEWFGPPDADGRQFGWFAYGGGSADETDAPDPVIRYVELGADEYGGPFWDDEGSLSEDFDELHRWLGISRALFDDVMGWNSDYVSHERSPTKEWERQHFEQKQDLLRRLASEVHPGITVEAPRAEPPVDIRLGRLNSAADGAHLVHWDEAAVETGEPKTLPALPEALVQRVLAWVADAWKYDDVTPENNAATFAWQDEGSVIARELQRELGDDYQVSGRP